MLNVSYSRQSNVKKENFNNNKIQNNLGFSSNPAVQIVKKEAQFFSVSESFKKANPFIKNWDKYIGVATAFTSAVGFSVGGVALMYDYLQTKGKKNAEQKNESGHVPEQVNNSDKIRDMFKEYRALIAKNNKGISFQKNSVEDDKNKNKGEETGNINPQTKFGKLGLMFAKIGVGFSGIAGIFNGIAMRLPLMAFGEGLNVAASPIINTPQGFGLMAIGLAGIFAGRALENDPALKLNTSVLASKPLGEKVKYLASNTWMTVKELGKSTKTTFGHLFNLVNPAKAQKAVNFFIDKIIAIRSSTLQFNESILADGTRIIKTGVKSHPYRMHTASVILALGGAILTIASTLNNKLGTKIGFKTCETGGGLDNIGLSCSGIEKMQMGNKASGAALAVSGLAILSGQTEAETQRGRAMQWIGCGLLFAAFVFERKGDLRSAKNAMAEILKTGKAKESAQLIRQWEVDLPNAISRADLKPHLNNFIKINKGGKEAQKAMESMKADPKAAPVAKLIEFMEGKFAQGKYKPSVKGDIEKQLQEGLQEIGINKKLAKSVIFVSEGKEREVAKTAIADNIEMFGKNYTPELQRIIEDPTTSATIKIEAEKAVKNLK